MRRKSFVRSLVDLGSPNSERSAIFRGADTRLRAETAYQRRSGPIKSDSLHL